MRSLERFSQLARLGQSRLERQLSSLPTGSKVYVSGAMSGLPGHNAPAFMQAEKFLTKRGFQVLNPARNETTVPGQYPNWSQMSERRQ